MGSIMCLYQNKSLSIICAHFWNSFVEEDTSAGHKNI